MQQPNAVIWFTQPPGKLASFYYYEPASKKMVRIRLELKRNDPPPANNNTLVIFTADRRVGFYDETDPAFSNIQHDPDSDFTTNAQDIILLKGKPMNPNPVNGLSVCDFTGKIPVGPVHIGNKVADAKTVILPPDIDISILTKVAQNAIAASKSKILTGPNASEQDVKDALIKLCTLSNF